ncbi:MAG TPA: prolyl oligopeptidase family serine peptidase [Anaeromyxobacter sp.]|nr:prolyl oligopeptidase family serine peptidase [Anaeromyxobacter sp.]
MLSSALVALPRAGAPDLPPGGGVAVFTAGPSSTVRHRTSSAPYVVPAAAGERLESVPAPAGTAIALGAADDERMCAPGARRGGGPVPTLVSVGELDYRPVDHGYAAFTPLQGRGVPSRLLVFSDEGNWVSKPKNARVFYDVVARVARRAHRPRGERVRGGALTTRNRLPFEPALP